MDDETLLTVSAAELRRVLDDPTRNTVRLYESWSAPETEPIVECHIGTTVTIAGVVASMDDVNTFRRSDGSEGQVRNITVQDRTGAIECALWGDAAQRDIDVGSVVHVADAEVEEGYQDNTKQVNVGYGARLRTLDPDEAAVVTLVIDDADEGAD